MQIWSFLRCISAVVWKLSDLSHKDTTDTLGDAIEEARQVRRSFRFQSQDDNYRTGESHFKSLSFCNGDC